MQNDFSELTKRVEKIEERNRRVELNKSWETSFIRRFSIAILTYCIVTSFFLITRTPNPFINALVPTTGFLLSTLSLDFIKKRWLNNNTLE
ncbi:MAG: hypothetical protein Q7S61_01375 [bacterium]|nr:hypothetical protein [bacterium]